VAHKRRRHRGVGQPRGFELPEWRAALEARGLLRWGLAGGVAAILVHSFVDFGLRQPANLLALMVVLALLVLSGRRQLAGGALSLSLLLVLFTLAAAPQVVNRFLRFAGATPLSPQDCLDRADTLLAEEGDAARGQALVLVRRALDRSPADREAHEALAKTLGPGPEGEEALRRALALHPWAAEVRDELGLRLWARGDHDAGAAELEESIFRFPYLQSHAYLSPYLGPELSDAGQVIRALVEGHTLTVRLARLEPDMVAAVERGLVRALDRVQEGDARAAIRDDLVTVLEARGGWGEAATLLRAEAERSGDRSVDLERAARDYLKAGDYKAAEQTLLTALLRTPEQGDLYRALAVDVYAARGDFPTAEGVLKAGERNALDMLPIYDGVTEVLARRESKHTEDFVGAAAPRRGRDGASEENPR
jgi:Tfp pilus assembly protein PilF